MKQYDLIVIGGGPGGYNSAEYAVKNGLKVALIERDRLGGTCLNSGCIPTKAFLNESKIYSQMKGQGVTLDHGEVVRRKDQVVDALIQGVTRSLGGVDIIKGEASIVKKDGKVIVSVGPENYKAEDIIIATGSSPVVPEIEGLQEEVEAGRAITSDEILNITEVPERLTIVGGGVIGFEMAAYFNEMGSDVTVVEMLDKVLGSSDQEVSQLLQKELERQGVAFHLLSTVTKFEDGGLTFVKDNQEQIVKYDKVLISVGRKANIHIKGLDVSGIQVENNVIVVNEKCETTVANVYAVGDVNGKITLAHVGYREGEVVINNIVGKKDFMSYDAICSVVYTSPEAAFVGKSEEEAKGLGIDYEVKKASINFSGRHVIEHGMSPGLCKIIIDKKRSIIIGASIVSGYASEYIYSLALMIENKIPVASIQRTVFPHPTVCEIIRVALFD